MSDQTEDANAESVSRRASYTACHWEYQEVEDAWETSCGEMFQFIAYGPEENGFEHCPYCGAEIEAVHAV